MVSKHRLLLGFIARLALVGGVAGAVLGVTERAAAQPSNQELREARATFQAGLALEAAGDFKNALVKFREVASVRQTPNVTYHIAVCLEQLGRWTEALGTYRMTIDSAREEGADNVAEQADQARQKLEARMPKLQIVRGKGAAGAVVELDGVRIGAASFGVEMPADPGGHRVVASIDDKEVFSRTVVLKEGRLETVTISVEKDEPPPPPPVENPKPAQIGPSQRTGYIFLGAGVTSLVVGGMFVKLRNDTIDQLESQCMGTRCDPSLEDTSDRGKIYMMAANAFLGAGVISAGIGTVVLLQSNGDSTAPSEPAPAPAPSVGVSLGGPKGPGATLWGKF